MTAPEPSAARAYQEVIARLSAAAEDLRTRDLDRAAELAHTFADLDDAMVRTRERAALTDMVVTLHWEAALDALWTESWMTLRPRPGPAPGAPHGAAPADVAELEAEVERAAAAVAAAVHRGVFRRRRP